jgi:Fic family protein
VRAAAWLHYHLYQVHPFQHGNGRIVRAATTQMMLRSGLLPIVIEREDRPAYKAAMGTADSLAPLAAVFARAARDTINRALSVAATTASHMAS